MNRKEPDWGKAFSPVPASFSARLERTIENLEEKNVKKRFIPCAALAAACILMLGTALALTNSNGIREFIFRTNGITPVQGAENEISRDLGQAESDAARLTVREAVYDGRTLRAVLAVEAKDPEHYVVTDAREGEYEIMDETTGETVGEYAARVGKTLLDCGFSDVTAENAALSVGVADTRREGETMVVYLEWSLAGEEPDEIQVSATLHLESGEDLAKVLFVIPKTETKITRYEIGETGDERIRLLSATREDSFFATYFTVEYELFPDLFNFDENATYYITEHGIWAHLDSQCSGMKNAFSVSGREAASAGKQLCPVCAGGNSELGFSWDVSALLLDADKTYYATEGKYLHLDKNCSGLENAAPLNAAQAQLLNKELCPVCTGASAGEAENPASGAEWSASAMYGTLLPGADNRKTYAVTLTMQAGEFPDGDLIFAPWNTQGEACEPTILKMPR